MPASVHSGVADGDEKDNNEEQARAPSCEPGSRLGSGNSLAKSPAREDRVDVPELVARVSRETSHSCYPDIMGSNIEKGLPETPFNGTLNHERWVMSQP
jgi:hypothetical protein